LLEQSTGTESQNANRQKHVAVELNLVSVNARIVSNQRRYEEDENDETEDTVGNVNVNDLLFVLLVVDVPLRLEQGLNCKHSDCTADNEEDEGAILLHETRRLCGYHDIGRDFGSDQTRLV